MARIVLVGLAPGLHGANRTARPFTGDFAGILLYQTLHRLGLATQPESRSSSDALQLRAARITNAVKCAPPQNKPLPEEIRRCNDYLQAELSRCGDARVLVALGRIAHDAVLMAMRLKRSAFTFAHGAEHRLATGQYLLDSYHCSRYNTQTRRLTQKMFGEVLERACRLAGLAQGAARKRP